MLFKNFDKFSSVLPFSTLKLLLFSWRKSLRFFSAHILILCVFFQEMCVKNAKRRPKIITEYMYVIIVGNHSTFFRYTPYVPWTIWLAKFHFHEYVWSRGDQSSSNEIACCNKILFNLNDVILGFSYLKKKPMHMFWMVKQTSDIKRNFIG